VGETPITLPVDQKPVPDFWNLALSNLLNLQLQRPNCFRVNPNHLNETTRWVHVPRCHDLSSSLATVLKFQSIVNLLLSIVMLGGMRVNIGWKTRGIIVCVWGLGNLAQWLPTTDTPCLPFPTFSQHNMFVICCRCTTI
jgi:hypothetical protein